VGALSSAFSPIAKILAVNPKLNTLVLEFEKQDKYDPSRFDFKFIDELKMSGSLEELCLPSINLGEEVAVKIFEALAQHKHLR
jgi:membrane carboxypeptidase/penicillin-binding protein PbpC